MSVKNEPLVDDNLTSCPEQRKGTVLAEPECRNETEVGGAMESHEVDNEAEVTASRNVLAEDHVSEFRSEMFADQDSFYDKQASTDEDTSEKDDGRENSTEGQTNHMQQETDLTEGKNELYMKVRFEAESGKNEIDKGNEESCNDEKKLKKRPSKKRKKPDELLKCIVCGRYGLTSEFCASGRFCSQRCVGAYASKCRAENLAAAAAAGEVSEPKRKIKQRKEGKKGRKMSTGATGNDKHGRLSPDFDDPLSPSLSTVSSSSEETKQKKAKLSLSDDAYFFYNVVGKEKPFDWELYLSITGKKCVPEDVFKEENPDFELYASPGTSFKPGMKLEAVDPRHPSCICAVSVVETQGARLRLHFDGWSESYDFWTNSDSLFLFSAGWCQKKGQRLHVPRGMSHRDFDWEKYLIEMKSEAAPAHLFREVHETTHGFTTSMKLEAVDKKNPDLTCVASITNVIGQYFLVHFDEWDDTYDYWCQAHCPYLHVVGWCQDNGIRLTPPQDDQVDSFRWDVYLKQTNTIAVPEELLQSRSPTRFEVGQKLEVVDPRNPSLLRVASVAQLDSFQVKIHFDGWDDMYDYWFDSASTDLHPVGWCGKTGHPMEPPPSFLDAQDTTLCPTPGCRGIGHVKGAKYTTHHSIFGCPYSPQNVSRGSPLVDRLANNSMVEEASISSRVYNCKAVNAGQEPSPDSTTKSELIKQQKLLKGIVGRPAKKPSEKLSYRTNKMFSKGNTKFAIKEKSRDIKKFITPNLISSGSSQLCSQVSSTSSENIRLQSRLSMAKLQNSKHRFSSRLETSQVSSWSVRDVAEFIKSIGLVEHAMHFENQQIDGQALLLLRQADMIHHMKIKLGPALKISNAVAKI